MYKTKQYTQKTTKEDQAAFGGDSYIYYLHIVTMVSRYTHASKLIKLYTFNIYILLCVQCILIKLFQMFIMEACVIKS